MKFSILVPIYNVEKFLPKCLKSIENQTYKDFEVILVDDGSQDSSGKICDIYIKNHGNNTIVIHKKNNGLISARRTGINQAKGEYCIFCDSDDFLENYALEKINKVIEKFKADLIIYNAYSFDKKSKSPFFEHILTEGFVKDKRVIYDKLLLSYTLNSICLKAVKRELFDRDKDYSQFYKCNFGEDLLQTIPVIKNAKKIYYLDECLYNYRITSGMMHKYHPDYYWSYRQVNLDIRSQLIYEHIENFYQKISLNLLIAAYGGITQLKYKDRFETKELEKINKDIEFKNALQCVKNSKYKNILNIKQKLILNLFARHKYKFIWDIIHIRSKK